MLPLVGVEVDAGLRDSRTRIVLRRSCEQFLSAPFELRCAATYRFDLQQDDRLAACQKIAGQLRKRPIVGRIDDLARGNCSSKWIQSRRFVRPVDVVLRC